MNRLRTFFRLPAEERRMVLKAFAVLAFVRLALRAVHVDRLRHWASRRGRGRHSVDRIAWAVRTAAGHSPGATCLASALTMQRLLSESGHVCELHIGVARLDATFTAHAWIIHDGEILVGEHGQVEYTRLVAWRTGMPDPI